MINGKLPNFLERDQATFYFSSISQYSNSPQFSLTSSNISMQRLRDILFFVPTAIKSESVGRPVLLTDVACSGIVQFVVVYIPMFLVTILLLNVLINQLSPYVSFSANCVKSTNSKENILTIIKCVLIVFTINIVIFTLWFLIFAKIFRLVAF